ncbi:Hypp6584 [Branchiostoma lanceolatum]|uniref:Hypp6584 protein n=1 Tax=Branchiostoma lanceolatum TaxID=7740 RepID=A0A8J9YV29_BRALA|nr:Hypp6584 [Branchiostoma lanceolatum]
MLYRRSKKWKHLKDGMFRTGHQGKPVRPAGSLKLLLPRTFLLPAINSYFIAQQGVLDLFRNEDNANPDDRVQAMERDAFGVGLDYLITEKKLNDWDCDVALLTYNHTNKDVFKVGTEAGERFLQNNPQVEWGFHYSAVSERNNLNHKPLNLKDQVTNLLNDKWHLDSEDNEYKRTKKRVHKRKLSAFKIFDPKNLPANRVARAQYGREELDTVLDHFCPAGRQPLVNRDGCRNEWMPFKELVRANYPNATFRSLVIHIKTQHAAYLPETAKLLQAVAVVPSEAVETVYPPKRLEVGQIVAVPYKERLFVASELRAWLLFYSLPIMLHFLPTKYYENYALLVTGLYILLKDSITEAELQTADDLLKQFVEGYGKLYGGSTYRTDTVRPKLKAMGMDVSDTLVSSRSQEAESTVPSSRRLSFSKSEKERLNSEKETQKLESILVEEGYYVRCQVEGADYVPCRQPITNPGAEKKLLDFLHKTVVYKKAENYIHRWNNIIGRRHPVLWHFMRKMKDEQRLVEVKLASARRDFPKTLTIKGKTQSSTLVLDPAKLQTALHRVVKAAKAGESEDERFEEEAEKARGSIGGHGRGQPTTPGALPARYHHVAPGVPTSATGLHLWWGARTPPGQEATKGTTHEIWRPNPRGMARSEGGATTATRWAITRRIATSPREASSDTAYPSGDDEDWALLNLANRPTADVGVDDLFEDKP